MVPDVNTYSFHNIVAQESGQFYHNILYTFIPIDIHIHNFYPRSPFIKHVFVHLFLLDTNSKIEKVKDDINGHIYDIRTLPIFQRNPTKLFEEGTAEEKNKVSQL